ncbi:MAG: hypothetical protein LZ167_00035 [Thaumarchaeota archaeon]|nr:hypothetical protein [Candidatus Geocrenenecus arthurdayi]
MPIQCIVFIQGCLAVILNTNPPIYLYNLYYPSRLHTSYGYDEYASTATYIKVYKLTPILQAPILLYLTVDILHFQSRV